MDGFIVLRGSYLQQCKNYHFDQYMNYTYDMITNIIYSIPYFQVIEHPYQLRSFYI